MTERLIESGEYLMEIVKRLSLDAHNIRQIAARFSNRLIALCNPELTEAAVHDLKAPRIAADSG